MSQKEAEKKFKAMCNYHGLDSYKNGDVRLCVACGAPQPKSERKPDYTISPFGTSVECKNANSRGIWEWSEIDEGGARFLQRQYLQENGGWLFIELGLGRAPEGKAAWLIPWTRWVNEIEPQLHKTGQKSIRMETLRNNDGTPRRGYYGGDVLFEGYEVEWKTYVGWTIPKGHVFWRSYHSKLVSELERLQELL
jgi:hypothetical protein